MKLLDPIEEVAMLTQLIASHYSRIQSLVPLLGDEDCDKVKKMLTDIEAMGGY